MHFRYLDALRGIAVLLVIVTHASLAGPEPTYLFFGHRGVLLFYVVSAFTLCMSMQARGDLGESSLVAFYIRRFWRVAPMFYLAFAANTLLTTGVNLGAEPVTGVLSTLTLAHGLFPDYMNTTVIGGWSVGVEVCFYALFPLLHRLLSNWRRAAIATLLGIIICTRMNSALADAYPAWRGYFQFAWIGAQLPVFFMGFLAYHMQKHLASICSPARLKTLAAGLALSAAALLWFSMPTSNQTMYISALAFVPALLALALAPTPWVVNRFTVFLGKISYSAYLIHFFVLEGLVRAVPTLLPGAPKSGLGGFLTYFAPALAITALLSWAAWRMIEQPGIAVGRAWIARVRLGRKPGAFAQATGPI